MKKACLEEISWNLHTKSVLDVKKGLASNDDRISVFPFELRVMCEPPQCDFRNAYSVFVSHRSQFI
jgi:hypothetical protein